jgi:hypothetical protein
MVDDVKRRREECDLRKDTDHRMHTGDAGEKWFVVGLTIRRMRAASESPAGRM